MELPPQLILPDHYTANRPTIIRPFADVGSYFPLELNVESREGIIAKIGDSVCDRAQIRNLVEAAIPFGMFAPASQIEVVFGGTNLTNSSLTTYTWNSQNLGDARSRWIVVAINGPNGRVMSSLTVGGVGGSNLYTGSSSIAPVWWKAQLSSTDPTSGTITYTYTSAETTSVVAWWIVYGPWDGNPSATQQHGTSAVNDPSMTINVLKNSTLLACARNVGPASFTWSVGTEMFDFTASNGGDNLQFSGSQYLNTGDTANVFIQATETGSSAGRMTGVVIP